MNCTSAQEKIIDAMAARESQLRGKLHQHVRECANCHAFLANQASLSAAMDAHLRIIATQPVPPSLLPGVRLRLEREAAPRLQIFGWRFAAIAAAVVLLVAAGIRMLRPNTSRHALEANVQIVRQLPDKDRPTSPQIPPLARKTSRVPVTRKAGVSAHSSATEVLVLPEEQQAFRRFVSHIAADQRAANALVSAVPGNGDTPVEIALLSIENVEVKPLDGTDSE